MSLVDMVLSEKTVLLGIGAALVPLLIALMLGMATNMRKAAVKRKARRALAAARRAETQALAAAEQAERAAVSAAIAASHGQPAVTSKGKESESKAKESKLSSEKTEGKSEGQEEKHEGEEEAGVSPAMQDILSSVFDDDSGTSPYTALLENLSTVDASNLVAFADQISTLLNAHAPAKANEEH